MRRFNARVEHGNFDVCTFAAVQERAGLLSCRQGACDHSLQPTVQLIILNSTSCDNTAWPVAHVAKCSG
jgi:hypothetical protein